MNKVTFTKHTENKFKYLSDLSIHIKAKDIEEAIFNPDYSSEDALNQVKIL